MAEVNRTDYGISEEEMSFDREKISIYKIKIDDSYIGILNQPANKVFAEFEKEFKRNDVEAFERFKDLNVSLGDLNKTREAHPFYDEMDIVTMMREILVRYKNWATALRQTAFLAKEKMKEIYDIIEKYYIPAAELQMIQENLDSGFIDKEGKIIFENTSRKYSVGEKVKILWVSLAKENDKSN
jgi:hypothetical protein